jgi:ATP-dependent RNA helicase HelY
LRAENGEIATASVHGRTLRRIYGERDLLVAECLRRGASGTISIPPARRHGRRPVYEPRRDEGQTSDRYLPKGAFRPAFERQQTLLWSKLDDIERDHKLPGSNRCPPACHSR